MTMGPGERALAAADAEDDDAERSLVPIRQMSTALVWICLGLGVLLTPVFFLVGGWKAAVVGALASLAIPLGFRRHGTSDPGIADSMLAQSRSNVSE